MADGTIQKLVTTYYNRATLNAATESGGASDKLSGIEAFTPQELEQLQNAQTYHQRTGISKSDGSIF